MTAAADRSLALIAGEYRSLIQFSGAPDGRTLADGALSAAAVCLGLRGSVDERLQQLRLAGALIACEMDRLFADVDADVVAAAERLRQAVDL